MDRRHFVSLAAAAAVLGVVSEAAAQATGTLDMHPPKYKALEEASSHCVATGNDCLRHCMGMFAMNDVSMASCADSVHQLVAACGALQTLAAANSTHLPSFAKAVREICVSCQKECEKYPAISACAACAQSCKACAAECDKIRA